jgi:hypothetical protein
MREAHPMARFVAACLVAFGLSVTWSGTAAAQATINVVAGHQVQVRWAYSVNPDCSSAGQIVVRITQPPQHGRVVIRNGRNFPNFPNSSKFYVCNTRRVPGVEAFYQSEPGYTGFDSVGFETIYPNGAYRQDTKNVQVR